MVFVLGFRRCSKVFIDVSIVYPFCSGFHYCCNVFGWISCLQRFCTPLGRWSYAVHCCTSSIQNASRGLQSGYGFRRGIAGLQHVKVPSFTTGGASHSSWMEFTLVLASFGFYRKWFFSECPFHILQCFFDWDKIQGYPQKKAIRRFCTWTSAIKARMLKIAVSVSPNLQACAVWNNWESHWVSAHPEGDENCDVIAPVGTQLETGTILIMLQVNYCNWDNGGFHRFALEIYMNSISDTVILFWIVIWAVASLMNWCPFYHPIIVPRDCLTLGASILYPSQVNLQAHNNPQKKIECNAPLSDGVLTDFSIPCE